MQDWYWCHWSWLCVTSVVGEVWGDKRTYGGPQHLMCIFSTPIAPIVHIYLFLDTSQIGDDIETISCRYLPLGRRVIASFARNNFWFSCRTGTHSRILLLHYRKLCSHTDICNILALVIFWFSYILLSNFLFWNRSYGCRVLSSYVFLNFACTAWQ